MGTPRNQLESHVGLLAEEKSSASAVNLQTLTERLDPARIPAHVAIIMDGNGRWARQHHLPSRLLGHREGYKTLRTIVHDAADLGLQNLTVYGFSSENWRRPKLEIDGLMALIENATKAEMNDLMANGIRMRFVGRREGLPDSLQREMDRATNMTAGNPRLCLNIAINYGGRAEITDATKQIAEKVKRGEIDPADITEELLTQHMYVPELQEPDLLIRTAGEMRISNFLLWATAYAEIWVTQTLWPDFTTAHLVAAIEDYQKRVRKFGAVA